MKFPFKSPYFSSSLSLCPMNPPFPLSYRLCVLLMVLCARRLPPLQDSVPHIALLGSGGGQRAAVALLGSLQQMGQDDLLDTLLYMGGVSGSGW